MSPYSIMLSGEIYTIMYFSHCSNNLADFQEYWQGSTTWVREGGAFPVILGKDVLFPPSGNSSPILSKICLDFGTV
jgi:hypothetical protein